MCRVLCDLFSLGEDLRFYIHFSAFTRSHSILVRLWQASQEYDCDYVSGPTEYLKVKDSGYKSTATSAWLCGEPGETRPLSGERMSRLKKKSGFADYLRESLFTFQLVEVFTCKLRRCKSQMTSESAAKTKICLQFLLFVLSALSPRMAETHPKPTSAKKGYITCINPLF